MLATNGQAYNFNAQDVRTWLEMFFADADGKVHISSTSNWAGRVYDLSDMDNLLAYVDTLAAQRVPGIYYRVTTLRQAPRDGGRGGEADSFYLPALWSDLDVAGPGHKTTKVLPPSEAEARRIIASSGLPEPTLWIRTGGGLHPYWMLYRPAQITDVERVKKLSVTWQKIIAHSATQLGYFTDGTAVADLARIMRLPGTLNRKTDTPQECTYAEGGSGGYFSFEELEQLAYNLVAPIDAQEAANRPIPAPPPIPLSDDDLLPGQDWARKTHWGDILVPAGWKFMYTHGGRDYWQRPDKPGRECSATVGHDQDVLFVFTTSTDFEAQRSYTKFGAYAVLQHGGDFAKAARALRAVGFGGTGSAMTRDQEADRTILGDAVRPTVPAATTPVPSRLVKKKLVGAEKRSQNDNGNADRILDRYAPHLRWVINVGSWATYDNGRWEIHKQDSVVRTMTRWTLDDACVGEAAEYDDTPQVDRFGNPKPNSSEKDKFLAFMNKSNNVERTSGAIRQMTSFPEIQTTIDVFDAETYLTNLPNGTLDSKTGTVRPHDPLDMLTKTFGASYDPDADCPLWKDFLRTNLPDPKTRSYFQRLIGYTLSGNANEKLMVYMHGPSDTGKTLVAQTLLALFGQYGYSAPKGSLAPRREDKGHDPDRDGMAGKRFITTSESRPGEEMDEALIKSLTGRDMQNTRKNYADLRDWRPEGVIWVASNQYPKITGDDDAIWTRIKVIPFTQQFLAGDPRRDNKLDEKLLSELPGILNWAIEGLRDYLTNGLGEAVEVNTAGETFRSASDGVTTWLEEGIEAGALQDKEDAVTDRSLLYADYSNWCRETEHWTPLKPLRFYERLKSHYQEIRPKGMSRSFKGISVSRPANQWLVEASKRFRN
jgi:putative DNA primase/helicase